ncbi:MAG: N4-gp56 family major capsid protein [Desulfurellales bacterium]|nr:MAG: N4-gp56 family major capsid protein [Desulfurellales bacterium]
MANTTSIDALRPEIWRKELFQDVIDNLYFTQNGMMGEDDNNIVQTMLELTKSKGDTVTFGLTAKLAGAGVDGDAELEGNEEAISAYSENVAIDQKRHAIRLLGRLDEQKNSYSMRTDAKNKLSIWMQEFIERQVFLKLGGVQSTTLVDTSGSVISAGATWSNTPDIFPAADEAAGSGNRYLCANTSGIDALTTSDKITPSLISKARVKAKLASPMVRPLRINGKDYYVLFVHPRQAYDLKTDATWSQAHREADIRGDQNAIFTGALGIWDGVIVHEHEYVPWIDVSALATDKFASGGTTAAVDCYRALLCGRQAVGFAKSSGGPGEWVEKSFDYDNKWGVATSLIGGIQKLMFNSKEYGVIALDTYATEV